MNHEDAINAALDALRTGDDQRAEGILVPIAGDGHAEATSLLGLARARSDPAAALKDLNRAIRLEPNEPRWWIHLGLGAMKAARWSEAICGFTGAIERTPRSQHKPLLLKRAEAEERSGDTIAALHSRTAAAHLGTPTAAEQYRLAMTQEDTMRFQEADRTISVLLNTAPTVPEIALAAARLARVLGDQARAVGILDTAIAAHPENIALLASRLDVCPDATPTNILERAAEDPAAATSDRRPAAFALARAFDRAGDHEKAWHFATIGNALYNVTGDPLAEEHGRTETAFALFTAVKEQSAPSPVQPIYIISPPRSGGTVLQTVLSAPDGHASLGERGALLSWLFSLHSNDAVRWEAEAGTVAHADYRGMAALAPGAHVVTDKTPYHAQCAGLIHKLQPSAHFIDLRRNLIDVLVSIYLHPFKESFAFATDVRSIASYLVHHRRTVERWRDHGVAVDVVSYSEFTLEPDTICSQLFQRLGWAWDSTYLGDRRLDAPVKTFSIESARQPIKPRVNSRSDAYRLFLGELPDEFLRLVES